MVTLGQQLSGFPARQMATVAILMFPESLAFTSLFPYLYFLIRDFEIAPTEKDIAKYSGYLASSFAFFQFLSAIQWGKLSDKIGRKHSLMLGSFGSGIAMLVFGFSKNFYVALAARSLSGACNGNVSVKRTMIGEIVTEKRHQALAFSTMPLLFNFGSIIGPAIGGSSWLTRPKVDSPYQNEANFVVRSLGDFHDRFLDKYPYALSNVVVSSIFFISLICGFLFLEESHEKLRLRRDYGVDLGDWILRSLGFTPPARPWNSAFNSHVLAEQTPLLEDSDRLSIHSETFVEDDESENGSGSGSEESIRPFLSRSMSRAIVKTYSTSEHDPVPTRPTKAFTPRVILVLAANFIMFVHGVAYGEFLPVFLAARFQGESLKFPFSIKGGFGLDSGTIGTLFSSTGIAGMLIVLVVFPIIDRNLGTINGYRLSTSIFPVVYFLVPLIIFTSHEYNSYYPKWVTPVLLYAMTSLKTLGTATGMPQVLLLNHRAAPKEHRTYVNSYAVSISSLGRFAGPIFFGYIMTVGERIGRGWLVWWIMALIATLGFLMGFIIEDTDQDEDIEKAAPKANAQEQQEVEENAEESAART